MTGETITACGVSPPGPLVRLDAALAAVETEVAPLMQALACESTDAAARTGAARRLGELRRVHIRLLQQRRRAWLESLGPRDHC